MKCPLSRPPPELPREPSTDFSCRGVARVSLPARETEKSTFVYEDAIRAKPTAKQQSITPFCENVKDDLCCDASSEGKGRKCVRVARRSVPSAAKVGLIRVSMKERLRPSKVLCSCSQVARDGDFYWVS